MKEIEKPSLVIDEISPDGRYGKFVWEPLERRYRFKYQSLVLQGEPG